MIEDENYYLPHILQEAVIDKDYNLVKKLIEKNKVNPDKNMDKWEFKELLELSSALDLRIFSFLLNEFPESVRVSYIYSEIVSYTPPKLILKYVKFMIDKLFNDYVDYFNMDNEAILENFKGMIESNGGGEYYAGPKKERGNYVNSLKKSYAYLKPILENVYVYNWSIRHPDKQNAYFIEDEFNLPTTHSYNNGLIGQFL